MSIIEQATDKTVAFVIPSFKRCGGITTPGWLESVGVDAGQIHIWTQTPDDRDGYAAEYGERYAVHFNPATNIGQQRNNALAYFEQGRKIVFLDDDIKSVVRLAVDGTAQPVQNIWPLVTKGFAQARIHGTTLWAIYPTPNPFFMSRKIDTKALAEGTLMGLEVNSLRFDPGLGTKEDYDYSCRVMASYGKVIRFCDHAAVAKHRTKGGCEEHWARTAADAKTLLKRWPQFLKANSRRPGEVLLRA